MLLTNCYSCLAALTGFDYGRGDLCRGCKRSTRVCLNCVQFEPSAYNQCLEPQADRVVEKTMSNFCDYFKPKKHEKPLVEGPSTDELKSRAESLFKKN